MGYGKDLLFYQNYTGGPFHWSFDHVWSLCVEEHFYVLLPLLFLVIQRLKRRKGSLFVTVSLMILAGIVCKVLVQVYTHSKDTYSATHTRIDGLAWGVLLNLLVRFYEVEYRKLKRLHLLFSAGLGLFVGALVVEAHTSSAIYHNVIFRSIVPLCFFLMLSGLYFYDFSKWRLLRVVAYYSYNWYLWHPVFVLMVSQRVGKTLFGLLVYLMITFVAAVVFTVLVEEACLAKRDLVLKRLFKTRERRASSDRTPQFGRGASGTVGVSGAGDAAADVVVVPSSSESKAG